MGMKPIIVTTPEGYGCFRHYPATATGELRRLAARLKHDHPEIKAIPVWDASAGGLVSGIVFND